MEIPLYGESLNTRTKFNNKIFNLFFSIFWFLYIITVQHIYKLIIVHNEESKREFHSTFSHGIRALGFCASKIFFILAFIVKFLSSLSRLSCNVGLHCRYSFFLLLPIVMAFIAGIFFSIFCV